MGRFLFGIVKQNGIKMIREWVKLNRIGLMLTPILIWITMLVIMLIYQYTWNLVTILLILVLSSAFSLFAAFLVSLLIGDFKNDRT
jgi:hypothetical protein